MTWFELAVIPLRQRGSVDHWPTCPHLYFTILRIIKNFQICWVGPWVWKLKNKKNQDACPFGGFEPPWVAEPLRIALIFRGGCDPNNFAVARLWRRVRDSSPRRLLYPFRFQGGRNKPDSTNSPKNLDAVFCFSHITKLAKTSHTCRCSCIYRIWTYNHSLSVNIQLNLLYVSRQLYG